MPSSNPSNTPSVSGDSEQSTATIIVHDWNCQCSACGYGGSSWAWMCSPGREKLVPIGQESENCPGCDAHFTGRRLAADASYPAPSYAGDCR
jgi:hypothetical protein